MSMILIVYSSVVGKIRFREQRENKLVQFCTDVILAVAFWIAIPRPSIVPLWALFTGILRKWPILWRGCPKWVARGGPLGYGCAKLVDCVVAAWLWRCTYSEWPPLTLGHIKNEKLWLGALLLSVAANIVLRIWSSTSRSRGNHEGVNRMMASSIGRSLTLKEHVRVLSLAGLNAICEEVSSRGFWRLEFAKDFPNIHQSNGAQALLFGMLHYHGVPSGLPGVVLTTVFGFAMGLLCDYGEGMFFAFLVHAIADYYIFAIVVRHQHTSIKES